MNIRYALALGFACTALGAASLAGCGDDDVEAGIRPDSGVDSLPPYEGGVPDAGDGSTPPPHVPALAKGPSNGSSVALSPDESRVVVCNRDKGSVTVFTVGYAGATPTMTKVGEVDLGAGTEPWQVAIDPAGDRAYVALRQGQKLVRIDGINGTPKKGPEAQVGSEPTGVALSAKGTHAYVANWVDGTVSDVSTETMAVSKTIDLNKAIVGLLGAGLTARPAMAHPRSVAVTNNANQDESDDFLYVTEYFGVRSEAELGDGSNADTSKRGVVYRVKLSNDNAETINIGPLADMGFVPTPGNSAGCFPNQLQSITLNGKFAYVLSVCASPRGPLGVRTTAIDCPSGPGAAGNDECNLGGTQEGVCQAAIAPAGPKCNDIATVKTSTAPLLSVIDTTTEPPTEVASSATNLNKRFFDRYAAAAVADDASRRMPLLANDLTFVPGTGIGYVSANGTNAVFRLSFAADGTLTSVGSDTPLKHFIDLTNGQAADLANPAHGLLPTGLVAGTKNHLFAANDVSRNVSVVSLASQTLAGGATPLVVESSAKAATETTLLKGRFEFGTGLGRWSLRGQGWGACQSCHTDGLTDNVTWYFGRGPRQSTSLDGSFSANGNVQRIFNWSAVFDDVADFEGNTRGTSGGVGAIVKDVALANSSRIAEATAVPGESHAGLNGSAKLLADGKVDQFNLGAGNKSVRDDWFEIDAYLKTIRSPRGARSVDPAKVTAGRQLFQSNNCQGCHGGTLWTTSELFYARTAADAFTKTEANKVNTWNVATLPLNITPVDGATTGTMRAGNAANDSLLCALREVGTFGVAQVDVGIAELRQDMVTEGQGSPVNQPTARGFSPPSLLGVSVGGPYLHAGNANTLEGLVSETFATHHRALSANFLDPGGLPADIAARRLELIHFLLSIDDSTTTIAAPAAGASGGKLCQ